MTVAVGSAPPGGSDALMQAASVKVSVSHRGATRRPEESATQQDESAPENAPTEELDASETRVDKSTKAAKRNRGKADSDKDKSFEDTFDTIGQAQGKDVGEASGKGVTIGPNLLLAPLVQGDPAVTKNSADGKTAPSGIEHSHIRPTTLLQQKSILAFLNAKDKPAINDGDLQSPEPLDLSTADQSIAQSQDETDPVPMSVDRLETHWNFGSNAITNVASQISALQSDGRKLPQTISVDGAAPASAKDQPQDSGTRVNVPRLDVQADPSGEGQSSSSSFSNNKGSDQGGAQAQVSAAPVIGGSRKDGEAESASLDKIFKTTTTPQQANASITTQVRDGVVDSLKNTGAPAPSPDVPARPMSAPVMKTLDLTLSPPDLGSVKLRLSLKSDSLTIEAEASKASTAKLLADDRQNLERGLKDAGYDVSSMKITDASASSSSNSSGWQQNGSPSRDGGDQSRSTFAGHQESGMQRRDGSSSGQPQRRSQESNSQPAVSDAGNGRLGNAVYI